MTDSSLNTQLSLVARLRDRRDQEAWSLYYAVYSGSAAVFVAELDPQTGKLVSPPKRAFQEFQAANYFAADWSPDGRYLASRSHRPPILITRKLFQESRQPKPAPTTR